MTLGRIHRGAQPAGPTRNCARPVASGGKALTQIAAIRSHRRLDPSADHPRQHLRRVWRELQLQQFLPHLLLRAAQVDDLTGEAVRTAEDTASKVQQFVDCRADVLTVAEIIAEIDDTVTP